MPSSWINAGVGAVGLANSLFGGGQSGQGGQANPYAVKSAGQQYDIANTVSGLAQPAYLQSYNASNAINFDPYQQGANQAGQQYGQMGQQAAGQAQNLYGAGSQIYNTAFDPQNALYARTQQQVGDQINAGQAQRGLGNSPEGASEYNQGMTNFNIDWQNNQLGRQTQGVAGMNAAGAGANTMGAAGAGYMQQAGQVPIQAQQYIAGMPAQNANAYANNMGNVANLYGTAAQTGNAYQLQANQAQQFGYNANAAQNSDSMNALMQGLGTNGTQSNPGGTGIFGAMNPYQGGGSVDASALQAFLQNG